ncbi:MAG: hypothetical protein QNJ54_34255 [Prochloraceae cyanobacterium]|nr:hypothetical protein [Prochloraceae cyanobacterium]
MSWRRLGRNCPICGGLRNDCRESLITNLIHCRHLLATPADYIYLRDDRLGFGMWQHKDSRQDFIDEKAEERRREKQYKYEAYQKELKEAQAQSLSVEERHNEISLVLEQLDLWSVHRDKLLKRFSVITEDVQECNRLIEEGGYKSVSQWQKLKVAVKDSLPGVKLGGQSLLVSGDGILCPIKNEKGLYIGWQVRLDKPNQGNKYLWLAGERKRANRPTSHLRSGELPIAIFAPNSKILIESKRNNTIGLAEGIAFKPQIAANRLGIPFIGASSGNFARSRQLLKQYLDFLGCDKTTEIVWFVDAGAITNLSVMGVYRRSIDLLRSWGYKLKIAWWKQIRKSDGDIDEIPTEKLETIEYISVEQFLQLARQEQSEDHFPPGKQSQQYGPAIEQEPDWTDYAAYMAAEEEEEKVNEAIANNDFCLWLKAKIRGLSNHFKGFATREVQETKIDKLPRVIKWHPGNPLPTPEVYIGEPSPRIIFPKGYRLEVQMGLKKAGWKIVWDSSPTGTGKSYDCGLLDIDKAGVSTAWYLDENHRNCSTPVVKQKYIDLEPRHEGQYLDRFGKLRLASTDEDKAKSVVQANCMNANLFALLKQQGWHAELTDTDAPNAICASCIHHVEKTSKNSNSARCSVFEGEGFGYRTQRISTLQEKYIRAHLTSLPEPDDEPGDRTDDDDRVNSFWDYSNNWAYIEEAGKSLTGIQSIEAKLSDFDRQMMTIATNYPDLFSQLKPLNILRTILEGSFPEGIGDRFGINHDELIKLLGKPPENIIDLLAAILETQPTGVIAEPTDIVDPNAIDKKWRNAAKTANRVSCREASHKSTQTLNTIYANWLEPLLKIWARLESGALRICFTHDGIKLKITTKNHRVTEILKAFGFTVLLDATLNKKVIKLSQRVTSPTRLQNRT